MFKLKVNVCECFFASFRGSPILKKSSETEVLLPVASNTIPSLLHKPWKTHQSLHQLVGRCTSLNLQSILFLPSIARFDSIRER